VPDFATPSRHGRICGLPRSAYRSGGDNQFTDPPTNRGDSAAMKLRSPIVTLLIGVLIAIVVYAISASSQPSKPYGAPAAVVAS
jgi:hypothetical protein